MKKIAAIIGSSVLISLITVLLILYSGIFSQKVGYVDSARLIEEYTPYQEAQVILLDRYKSNQNQLESVREKYIALRTSLDSLSEGSVEYQNSIKNLNSVSNEYQTLQENLEKQLKDEDENLTIGVINQLNAEIAAFAKENGYKIILGTANEGTIVFGDPSADITEDVSSYLKSKSQK